MMIIMLIRPLVPLLMGAIAAGISFAAAPQAEVVHDEAGTVVRLSPYEVSANSVDFEHWVKYASPHFIVYTDASAGDAARALGEFELLHLAAEKYFDRPSFQRSPTIVVLPTERSDWRKLESTAAVEWHVAVAQVTRRLQSLVLVGYNWQGWIVGNNVLLSALGKAELQNMKIEGPLWFSYGTGLFFEKTEFEENSVTLGKMSVRARSLWLHGWQPWPDFFKATSSSPEFTKSSEVKKFTGQSAAFVHYLLTHRDPVWRERLMNWAAMLQAGREPTEEAFKSVFGQGWEAWQATMKTHVHDRHDKTATIAFTTEEQNFPRTKIEVTAREMRELFVLSQILAQKKPASETALDLLLAKGLKTEALRELLVEAAIKWKRTEAAEEQLQTLMAAGSTNPDVYAAAAEIRFRAQVPVLRLRSKLGGERAAEIRRWCEKALALEPRHPDAGNLLAWSQALGPKIDSETVAALEKAVQAKASVGSMQEVVGALGIAYWRTDNVEGARRVALTLRDSPYTNHRSRDLAAALLAEIGPAP